MIFASPLKYLALTADFSDTHVANDLGWNSKQGGSQVNELAMADGVVEKVTSTEEGGNIIVCRFDDNDNTWYSVYRHCSKILKQEKDAIVQGEPIAKMGKTGTVATGSHLHVELLKCPRGTEYKLDDSFRKKYAVNPRLNFYYDDTNVISPKSAGKFMELPKPKYKYEVGDKVKILSAGNSKSDGSGKTCKGIGWKRYIKDIVEEADFPYKVGNAFGTTGYYKEEALEEI